MLKSFVVSVMQRLSVFMLIYSGLSLIRIFFYFDYYKDDLNRIAILFIVSILILILLPVIDKNLDSAERKEDGD